MFQPQRPQQQLQSLLFVNNYHNTNYRQMNNHNIEHIQLQTLQGAMQQSITKLSLLSSQLNTLERIARQTRSIQSVQNYQYIFDEYQNEYNVCLRLNQSIENVTITDNIKNMNHINQVYNYNNHSLISNHTYALPQYKCAPYAYSSHNTHLPTTTLPPHQQQVFVVLSRPKMQSPHISPSSYSSTNHTVTASASNTASFRSYDVNISPSSSSTKVETAFTISPSPHCIDPKATYTYMYKMEPNYPHKACNIHFKQCVQDSLCKDAKRVLIASKRMIRDHSDWFTRRNIFSETLLLHDVIKCFMHWIKYNIPEQSGGTEHVYEFMLYSISSILLNPPNDATICCLIQCVNTIMAKTMHSDTLSDVLFDKQHGLIIKLFSSNLLNPSRHRNILLHLSKTLHTVCKMAMGDIETNMHINRRLVLNKLKLLLFCDDLEILSHVLVALRILIENERLYLEIESMDINIATDVMLLYEIKHNKDVMVLHGFVSCYGDGVIPMDVVGMIAKYYCCYEHVHTVNTLQRMMDILHFPCSSCSYFVRHCAVEILRSIIEYEGEELVFSINESVLDSLSQTIHENDDIITDLYWLIHDIIELNVDQDIRDAFDADLIQCMIQTLSHAHAQRKIDLNVLAPLWYILQYLEEDAMRIVIEEYDLIQVFCGLLMNVDWSEMYEHGIGIGNSVLGIFDYLLTVEWQYNDGFKTIMIQSDAINILQQIRRNSNHQSIRYRALGLLAIHFDICDAKEQEIQIVHNDHVTHEDELESSMELEIYDSHPSSISS